MKAYKNSDRYLLRMEGVNIYEIIDDADKLNVRRGGGLLLREAVNEIKKIRGLKKISTGASVGLFELSEDSSRTHADIEKDIKKKLSEEPYKYFTFVVDIVPLADPVEDVQTDFQFAKEAVLARNRFRQYQQPTLVFPERNTDSGQIRVACEWDRIRPGVEMVEVKTSKASNLVTVSSSIKARHDYGRDQKKKDFYIKECEGVASFDNLEFTQDFHELAEGSSFSQLNKKIAVIYFDGNSFGKIQSSCRTAEELNDFDDRIKSLRKGFLCKLLEDIKDEDHFKNDEKIRLETLLWGGDEVIFVVPAWQGFRVLHAYYDHFRGEDNELPKLTHAGGMVFCNMKTPIARVEALARELAEHVKESPGGRERDMFDYAVLESVDYPAEPLEQFWESCYAGLATSRRPVTPIENWNQFSSDLRRLLKEELSKGQIYAVARAAVVETETLYKKRIDRAKDVMGNEIYDNLQKVLSELFAGHDEQWHWLHLVELWDYLELASLSEEFP